MKHSFKNVVDKISIQDNRKEGNGLFMGEQSLAVELPARLTHLLNRCTGKDWVLVIKDDPENESKVTTEVKLSNDNIYQLEDACREANAALYPILPLSLTGEEFVKQVANEELSKPVRRGNLTRFTISFPNPEITEAELKKMENTERSTINSIKKTFEGAGFSADGISLQRNNERGCSIL